MVSPLSGPLASLIYTGMKALFLDATLSRDTFAVTSPDVSFDPAAPTTADYACKAIVEVYALKWRQDGLIKQNDRRVMILANSISVTPTVGDRVTISGTTFTLQDVETDPATAVWTCQGRM